MTLADRAALTHYRVLLLQRGETVRYAGPGIPEPVELDLVKGGDELTELGGVGTLGGRVSGFLAHAPTLRGKIGRLPEEGDTITRTAATLIGPDADPEDGAGEVYLVARGDGPRVWRPHGSHGGLIRITAVLRSDGDG
ncbi:MAG: hypothetical protein AAF805_00255 [Planctomycetota bacterium]